jgi:hypothetical protein
MHGQKNIKVKTLQNRSYYYVIFVKLVLFL